MGPKADESKRFSWTAETAEDAGKDLSAACLSRLRRRQVPAQAGEIFPVCLWRTGTRVLWSRHAFFRACPKEGLIGYGSVLSACLCEFARRQATSAVRNLA